MFSLFYGDKYAVFFRMKQYYLRKSFSTFLFFLHLRETKIIFSPVVINGVHYVDGGLFHNFPVSIIRDRCERVIGVNVSPLVPQKYKQTIFHIAERSYHYMFRANTLEDREMCDVLIEAEEFGMYKTFDLENVEQIARIGYDAAIRAFELVIQENKHETLVKAIMARKNNMLLP